MSHPIRYLRGYVYPRGRTPFSESPHLRAADAVLGVVTVLSAVLAVAYVLTIIAGLQARHSGAESLRNLNIFGASSLSNSYADRPHI